MADRTVVVQLRAAVGQFNAQMAQAAASTKAVASQSGTAQTQVGKLGSTAGGASGMLKKLAGPAVLGGVALGMKAAADAAIGWESAFADVRKTVSGSERELGAISDGLRDMSTVIPTAAEDLAGIAASAGQLGIETDNILGFTRTIADLGETTNLSAEQGATSLARFANVTQMSQDDFGRLGSTVVDLGNNFATTESEIVEFAQRLAGAGSQVGMAESDILAIGTALSSVGINAEAGGTAISKVMIEIANQVETGGDKLGTFARVAGQTSDEFAESWRTDAAGALVDFVTGLGDVEEQGGNTFQVLEELGITEQRMRDALLRTSGAQDVLTDALKTGEDAWSTNLALQLEAAQRYDTTAARVETLGNRFHDMLLEMADPEGGTGLLDLLDRAITKMERISDIDPPGGGEDNFWELLFGREVQPGAEFLPEGQQPLPAMTTAGGREVDFTEPMSAGKRMRVDATESARWSAAAAAYDEYQEAVQGRADEAATARLAGLAEAMGVVSEEAGGATLSIADQQSMLDAQATSAEKAREAMSELGQQQLEIVTPISQLNNALEGVDQAQQAYTEAVEEHGKKSDEAQDAAFDLAEAQAQLEAAALNGDLSFDQFSAKLDDWVASGRITEEQAKTIRGRVAELRGEAEDYQGDYWANMQAATRTAAERLRELRGLIGDISGSHAASMHVTYTHSGAAAIGRPGAGGRIVVHDGGWIGAPRFHGGGMSSDEVPAVLQRGEFVVNRQAAGSNAALLEAINSGAGLSSTNDNRTLVVHGEPSPKAMFRARNIWARS